MSGAGRTHIRNLITIAGSRPKPRPASTSIGLISRSYRRLNKKTKKRLVRFSLVFANVALVALVGFAVVGFPADESNQSGLESARAQSVIADDEANKAQPLDKLAATDVAVHISRLVRMEESTAVTNKADTATVQLSVSSSDDQVISKPQIVSTGLKSKKDIRFHTVAAGESVTSIANKYGLTPDTVRFSNGLSGEDVAAGRQLTISPVNGITYTVKDGDTPDSLAARYNVAKAQLIAFNDAEITGSFRVGETIVIPDAIQPNDVRTASYGRGVGGYTNAAGGFAFGGAAIYGGNGYDFGWCTWHAANRRIQVGKPLPTNLGNAISWLSAARRAGLSTGNTPQEHAVVYHKNIGGLGHVAFVEKVNPDGSALVSDMNYPTWGRVTTRTVQPSEFGNYAFIY